MLPQRAPISAGFSGMGGFLEMSARLNGGTSARSVMRSFFFHFT